MAEPFQLICRRNEGGGCRATLIKAGSLIEYYEDEAQAGSLVGAILLGRVERVLPGVNAAFVQLGLKQNGFLPLKEQESFQKQNAQPLVTGRDVVVQVKKDAKGEKGVFLTRDVALPGQFGLVLPNSRYIGVSKRIEDENQRERVKALGVAVAKERFGMILRHAALFTRPEAIEAEAEALYTQWQKLTEAAECQKAPAMLQRPVSIVEALLRDYAARHDCVLQTELDPPADLPKTVTVSRLSPLEIESLWNGLAIERQLNEALQRRVPLKTGGDLVIDQREALQTVDVNSGSKVEACDGLSLPLWQNLAAVPEIARQLRLRNLAGIILVDFIDMATEDERERVRAAMTEAVKDDRVKTVVHAFTELGLLEITRKRTRDSLQECLSVPCGACHGAGYIRNA